MAATYVSSRAFPSSLLSAAPSAQATSEDSYPVLLPVLDCLNHTRGHPVTWQVTSSPLTTPTNGANHMNRSSLHIALVLRSTTPAKSEVFNNYGPKPNSELLLGYGFVIPSNPEDTIVLKLGGSEKRHEIGRDVASSAQGGSMDELWKEVENMVLSSGEDDASVTSLEGGWEVTLEVCEALEDMLIRKMEALPDAEAIAGITVHSIRPDVRDLIAEYVQGECASSSRRQFEPRMELWSCRSKGYPGWGPKLRGWTQTRSYRTSTRIGTRSPRGLRGRCRRHREHVVMKFRMRHPVISCASYSHVALCSCMYYLHVFGLDATPLSIGSYCDVEERRGKAK